MTGWLDLMEVSAKTMKKAYKRRKSPRHEAEDPLEALLL